MDDENLRLALVMRDDVYEQEGVAQLWKASLRGLARPEARGFQQDLLSRLRTGPTYSRAGVYLGHRTTFNVDLDRLGRVVGRTIRGLYYHHHGRRLPSAYGVVAYSSDGFREVDDCLRQSVAQFARALQPQPVHRIGGKVFEYKWRAAEDDPHATVWFLRFYSRVFFFALTAPRAAESSSG